MQARDSSDEVVAQTEVGALTEDSPTRGRHIVAIDWTQSARLLVRYVTRALSQNATRRVVRSA